MGNNQSRRNFLAQVTGVTAGLAVTLSGSETRRILGANDRVLAGVIGYGEMGTENMESFLKHPGVEIGAVCDVYQPRLEKGIQDAGGKAKAYKDFRQVLDDKDIDVVIIATRDNWHALQMVMACQAGKDVYFGIEFHGTDGTLFLDRDGFKVFPEKWEYEPKPAE